MTTLTLLKSVIIFYKVLINDGLTINIYKYYFVQIIGKYWLYKNWLVIISFAKNTNKYILYKKY